MHHSSTALRNICFILFAVTFILLFGSCNRVVMKRKYRPGFFVENNKFFSKPHKTQTDGQTKNEVKISEQTIVEQQTCSVEKTRLIHSNRKKALRQNSIASTRTESQEGYSTPPILNRLTFKKINSVPEAMQSLVHKSDPENSLVQKPLSLFWIVVLLVLIVYLAVILFAAESLLPLGHVLGIIFAGLLLLWLLRVF